MPINYQPFSLPPSQTKTYSIHAPAATHFRKASCEEIGCEAMENGFASLIDETTELGKKQAYYIRKLSGRKFTEDSPEEGKTLFTFEAGQTCFTPHQVPLGKPELYIVRDGDYRRYGNGRLHANAEDWVDDFVTHQDKFATAIERG